MRNVSSGGLSLHVELAVEQGDVLHLALQPNRRTQIAVEAIVWHIQAMRDRKTGRTLNRLGLVLSEAPDDYVDLLQGSRGVRRARSRQGGPTCPPEPKPRDTAAGNAGETDATLPSEKYRVRVKHDLSPRTRSIVVFAADADAARVSAQSEIDPGWHILEIEST